MLLRIDLSSDANTFQFFNLRGRLSINLFRLSYFMLMTAFLDYFTTLVFNDVKTDHLAKCD